VTSVLKKKGEPFGKVKDGFRLAPWRKEVERRRRGAKITP